MQLWSVHNSLCYTRCTRTTTNSKDCFDVLLLLRVRNIRPAYLHRLHRIHLTGRWWDVKASTMQRSPKATLLYSCCCCCACLFLLPWRWLVSGMWRIWLLVALLVSLSIVHARLVDQLPWFWWALDSGNVE